MWSVSLFNTCFDDGEADALRHVLQSGWVSMGAVTERFEHRFAQFVGARHAIAVSSGTAALHLANSALGIGPGDEVLCPALTFVATANAIIYAGGRPVFADIRDEGDLTVSPTSIEERITRNTRAITVVHYAGFPCDMDAIMGIARRHNLYVIEDCAHSPGARIGNLHCGAIGDVGCFSFFANKNMTTAEGGMVTTNNDMLAHRIRRLRSHGMTSTTFDRHKGHAYSYDVTDLGYNYRIDELRSALGLRQLEKLVQWNARRIALRNRYIELLSNVESLTIPFLNPRGENASHIFPILLKEDICRRDFMAYLKTQGVQTSIHYPPVHLFDYYRCRYGFSEGLLPRTEQVAAREVTLPLYPDMKAGDITAVSRVVKSFFRQRKDTNEIDLAPPVVVGSGKGFAT